VIFWRFLAAKEWITTKWMEIDYDYLRTGTAISFRASRELCSNYLFEPVGLQVLNQSLVSTAKWHITSPVYRQCINKLARLAWKWLQIGTDMLLIITSTGDELLRNVNINDLEWPLTPHIKGFSEFFAIWGCDAHFKTELCWKSCR